jgi:hypothetical protein
MGKIDDAIARFEARNADAISEEHAAARRSRMFCFTRTQILRAIITASILRACKHGNYPPEAFEPDVVVADNGLIRPAFNVVRPELIEGRDLEEFARFFAAYIKITHTEWRGELRRADEDEAGFQEMGAWCDKRNEANEDVLRRIKKWAS